MHEHDKSNKYIYDNSIYNKGVVSPSVCMHVHVCELGHMNTMIDVWSQRTALDIGPILGFYCYDTTA